MESICANTAKHRQPPKFLARDILNNPHISSRPYQPRTPPSARQPTDVPLLPLFLVPVLPGNPVSVDHAEGLDLLTQLEKTEPSFSSTHDYLGRIYWETKHYEKALAEWKRLAELRHDEAGLAIAKAREKGLASDGLTGLLQNELPIQKDLVDHGSGSAYGLSEIYAGLGMRQEALACLHVALDRHEEAMLVGVPILPLEGDPEYQKLRALVNQRLEQ